PPRAPSTLSLHDALPISKAFRAACTPDFFLFDRNQRLAYRGQFDDSRPGNKIAITGSDLRNAADAVLNGETPSVDQKPSIGCNIDRKSTRLNSSHVAISY